MNLLIATTNPGKIREFREMLGEIPSLAFTDLSRHPELPPVEETAHTFLANACLKASAYARLLKTWSLADDSGLAVDALAGSPGVLSARWASVHNAGAGDQANNTLLLSQLAPISAENRTARFICALALANPAGKIVLTTMGSVEGRILSEPRGAGGFGYDPLFLIDALNKTTAELPPEEKHRLSHRGQALRRMVVLLAKLNAECRMPNAE
jgi:XTP/dITP diphosphohydrolase